MSKATPDVMGVKAAFFSYTVGEYDVRFAFFWRVELRIMYLPETLEETELSRMFYN